MSETPEFDEQDGQLYFVFFAANVQASDPGAAVRLLVDRMVETGLRKWAYRVDTIAGTRELVGYYDGHGEPLPLPIVDAPLPDTDIVDVEVGVDLDPASSAPSPTLDTETDDDALTAYAGTLNQS